MYMSFIKSPFRNQTVNGTYALDTLNMVKKMEKIVSEVHLDVVLKNLCHSKFDSLRSGRAPGKNGAVLRVPLRQNFGSAAPTNFPFFRSARSERGAALLNSLLFSECLIH